MSQKKDMSNHFLNQFYDKLDAVTFLTKITFSKYFLKI